MNYPIKRRCLTAWFGYLLSLLLIAGPDQVTEAGPTSKQVTIDSGVLAGTIENGVQVF